MLPKKWFPALFTDTLPGFLTVLSIRFYIRMEMTTLRAEVAYGTFFATLFTFGLLVIYSTRRSSRSALMHPGPAFISAKGECGWFSVGMSLYASFMGNWVVFLPPITGSMYSWSGIVGYALSSSLPYFLLMWMAPRILRRNQDGFCSCDHLANSFGRGAQGIAAVISFIMMFMSLCTELTTVGVSMQALSGDTFPVSCAVTLVAIVPLMYVFVGGLKCCIVTDVVQAIIISTMLVPLVFYLLSTQPMSVWLSQSYIDVPSVVAGGVLILSVWPIFLIDQGIWQRVWAARSVEDMKKGMMMAGIMAGMSVLLFGIAGLVCISADDAEKGGSLFAYAASQLPLPWVIILCIMALSCVTSSVDTYQSAIISLIGRDLKIRNLSFNWARLALVVINIPAVFLALNQVPIITLFMLTNMACSVLAGPFLLSLHPRTTSCGFLGGLLSALLVLLCCALGFSVADGGKFIDFSFFAPNDVSTVRYLVTFALVPMSGAAGTAVISWIQYCTHSTSSSKPVAHPLKVCPEELAERADQEGTHY